MKTSMSTAGGGGTGGEEGTPELQHHITKVIVFSDGGWFANY